jgi:hypothetical protein
VRHGRAALSGSNPKAPGSAGGYLLVMFECYVEGHGSIFRDGSVLRPGSSALQTLELVITAFG